MKIFMEPNDVLFFRDGKPFEAGNNHHAGLSFPPTPITFYGAIKASLLSLELNNYEDFTDSNKLSEEMKKTVGAALKNGIDPSENAKYAISEGSLKITNFGIGIAENGKVNRLFPLPADVVKLKHSNEYFILKPQNICNNERTNFPISEFEFLGNEKINRKYIEEPTGLFTEDGFKAYLQNQDLMEKHFIPLNEIFKSEDRVCVARDHYTHTATDGMLYSIEFARMNKYVGFYIEIEGLNSFEKQLKQIKTYKLGGESKSVICNYDVCWDDILTGRMSGKFKIISLSHSIFKNGWLPDGINSTGTGIIRGANVKLVSAAVKKYTGVGGWDIVNKKSKPVRRAVPAGSVYYFSLLNNTIKTNQTINLGQDTEKGLGQAIIGGY